MTPPRNVFVLTHGDVDGICAATLAKTYYPNAKVEFATPNDFISKLAPLSGNDCVIILDLGIAHTKEAEAQAAFRKLSKTSDIIYIDHHLRSPRVTKRSLACNGMLYRVGTSTSELAWEFFKPDASYDFIAALGAVGDYAEKTPSMQGLIEIYGERKVYPEALLLEWALMVAEDPFKKGVIEELFRGRWPYQMSIMGESADGILRRQMTLERYVQEKAEKICENVMLIRDPPFKATGSAATLLINLDNVDVGIASRLEGDSVYLSLRRRKESDVNLASLIEESTLNLGGMGGGHKAAAGGKIPVERFDELLQEIKRRLPKGQLIRKAEFDVEAMDKKTIERKLFREIIEHKRAEERRRRAELEAEAARQRAAIIDAMGDGLILVDMNGKIISVNPAYEKMMGYKKDEIIGKKAADLAKKNVNPEDVKTAMESMTANMRGEVPSPITVTLSTKDDREVSVIITSSIIKDSEGKPSAMIVVFKDITESKKVEEYLEAFKEP